MKDSEKKALLEQLALIKKQTIHIQGQVAMVKRFAETIYYDDRLTTTAARSNAAYILEVISGQSLDVPLHESCLNSGR